MRIALYLGIAFAAVLTVPPAAEAAMPWHAPVVHYQGETPAPRWVVEVAGRASAFWADRGVTGCSGIETYEAPTATLGAWSMGNGRDDVAGCAIWVSTDLVASVSQESFSLSHFRGACQAITHEVGHALGLNHTPTGVMSVQDDPTLGASTPWFCRVWARWAVSAAVAHDARFSPSPAV